jgi:large subunit ribosomal protein L23
VNPYSVLLKPLLSEKTSDQREMNGKYTFAVDLKATKNDVKSACKKLYDVDAVNIRTITTRGKIYRRGMSLTKPKLRKKAIVTLAEGQRIKIFDDQ